MALAAAARRRARPWSSPPIRRRRSATPSISRSPPRPGRSARRPRACTRSRSTPRRALERWLAERRAIARDDRPARHLARSGRRRRGCCGCRCPASTRSRRCCEIAELGQLRPLRPASSSTPRRPGTRCACWRCRTPRGVARVFDHMQAKHRVMVEALRGGWTAEPPTTSSSEIGQRGRGAWRRCFATATQARAGVGHAAGADGRRRDARRAGVRCAATASTVDRHRQRVTRRRRSPCRWCERRRRIERRRSSASGARGIGAVPDPDPGRRHAEPRGVTAARAIGGAHRARSAPRRRSVASRATGRVTASLPPHRCAYPRRPRSCRCAHAAA